MTSIIILGSARSDGNTKNLIDRIRKNHPGIELINLSDYEIGYFDYEFANQEDDFIPICEKMVQYDNIIFASPVYWYSMSAQLKTFFDRLTDLMKIRKDLGRKLNGKSMMSVSCGSGPLLKKGFEMPFKESANYLEMKYLGHFHGYLPTESQENDLNKRIQDFTDKIKSYEQSFSN